MKTSRTAQSYLPAKELAEVHRDVLNFLAHETGGIGGALGLRVDALGEVLPASDQAAFHGLVNQIRDVYRVLRLLEGPRGEMALAPARETPVGEWWRVVSRMVGAALPRGMTIMPTYDVATLSPRQAHLLTTMLLLACRDVRDRGVQAPATLSARFTATTTEDAGIAVELALLRTAWPEHPAPRLSGRWQRYAGRVARQSTMELRWWSAHDTVMQWRCVVR